MKKIVIGVALLVVVAAAAVFLFSSSEEKAIEKLLQEGARAAERGDAEAVIALLSKGYKGPGQDYEGAVQEIRRELGAGRRFGQLEIAGSAIHVDGDEADASVRVKTRVGPRDVGELGLRLRLRKEGGAWKVTSAEKDFR